MFNRLQLQYDTLDVGSGLRDCHVHQSYFISALEWTQKVNLPPNWSSRNGPKWKRCPPMVNSKKSFIENCGWSLSAWVSTCCTHNFDRISWQVLRSLVWCCPYRCSFQRQYSRWVKWHWAPTPAFAWASRWVASCLQFLSHTTITVNSTVSCSLHFSAVRTP